MFIGESIHSIYDYEINGIWQISEEGQYPDDQNVGAYKWKDLNGDGKLLPQDDMAILGRAEPAYSFGIQNSFSYKNLSLNFFINSIQGGKDGYLGRQFAGSDSPGNFSNTNIWTFYDHWSVTNPDGKYSVWYEAPQINPAQHCSRSFVRLQDISLSYKVNPNIIKNIGMQDFKVFISGKNLLTFTNWDGWDPETNQGIGGAYHPVMKSITLGIDFKF